MKTYFARSADWQMVAFGQKPSPDVLERCIFKHRTQNVYLIADAYRGSKIQHTIMDFLEAAAGGETESVPVQAGTQTLTLNGRGGADLVAYAGHDGLWIFNCRVFPGEKAQSIGRRLSLRASASLIFPRRYEQPEQHHSSGPQD